MKKPSWTKWLFLSLALIILAIIIFLIILYNDIQENKTKGFDSAIEHAIQETELEIVETIKRFHGNSLYYVITGHNQEKEQLIVFVPENDKEEITVVAQRDILSEEKILADWKRQCNDCVFIDIIPAIMDDEILWEITYYDQKNRYVLDYVSAYDGSKYEEFRFNKMFD